jgi:hypothetical protein
VRRLGLSSAYGFGGIRSVVPTRTLSGLSPIAVRFAS